ncbi:hypothetical protein TNCV_1088091 [Trichonephila clavipes]|uniref:Uncharacterized protein n=1 Tax=Trichonephila clavipes TaxID=2585209 RepID=A0A8X6VQ22_TRICX|nr:hypothetical protein TNCV_1088091 [Trichonephila clavipes]
MPAMVGYLNHWATAAPLHAEGRAQSIEAQSFPGAFRDCMKTLGDVDTLFSNSLNTSALTLDRFEMPQSFSPMGPNNSRTRPHDSAERTILILRIAH